MKRGDIYIVRRPGRSDPKRRRAFVVVSRQVVIDSRYDTVVCAPIYTVNLGLTSQVAVGPEEGLRHQSVIHCDGLSSIEKNRLTDFVGTLSQNKLLALDQALRVALALD